MFHQTVATSTQLYPNINYRLTKSYFVVDLKTGKSNVELSVICQLRKPLSSLFVQHTMKLGQESTLHIASWWCLTWLTGRGRLKRPSGQWSGGKSPRFCYLVKMVIRIFRNMDLPISFLKRLHFWASTLDTSLAWKTTGHFLESFFYRKYEYFFLFDVTKSSFQVFFYKPVILKLVQHYSISMVSFRIWYPYLLVPYFCILEHQNTYFGYAIFIVHNIKMFCHYKTKSLGLMPSK